MKSRKFLALAVLAATFLSATSVLADEVSPEDKERAYQMICVQAPKDIDGKDLADSINFRTYFHGFLRQPELILPKFEELKKASGLEGIGLAIEVAASCGAVTILQKDIETRGCKDESGKEASIQRALEICGPIVEWLDKAGK